MKITIKKSFAVVMALVMCVSVLFGMNLSAFAADTNTVDYVYSGNYVYNWGEREEEATFLSPMAIKFYSDNNVSLSELLALSGSSTESGVPSSALYRELHELMESNHTYTNSYENVKNLCKYTDCQNSGGKISSFYSGKEIGPEWNSSEWNREHTWPNSKGDKAGNGENDIMMLRPTASSENSSRGNKAYGTTTTNQYYNPNDEGKGAYDLRGDVARIILYQYVRWECTNTGSSYNSTGIFGSNGVIESKDVLLDWIEADPVDTWELGRNDAVEAITGTRNVFVDYPELAFDLFNEDVPADYTSPSDGTSIEGTTDTGGSDNTDDNTTSTPGAEIVFNLGANGAATHSDGSSKTSYTETVDGYTLNITGGSSFYTGARDAKGNSAFKMGTSSKTGSFSLTAPDDVIKVIFNVAAYKTTAAKLNVNGTAYTISTPSNNGEYTAVEVDTSSTKNITFATASGGERCMINSITFVVAGSSDDTTDENKVFVDGDGLVISGPISAFDENVVVAATKLTAGDDFNTAQTALADKASQFTLYDITATVGGTAVQPSGEITITLDIPSGYDPDHVCIAYIDDDGNVEELESSAVDKAANTVSATLEHFSLYAVIDTSNVSTDDGDDSGNSGDNTQIVEKDVTISFASTAQRDSLTTTQQVWSNDGLTFTNNKASSTSNVADYSNPARFYASSSITLEHTGQLKAIVFNANSNSYATALKNSIGTVDGATVTVNSKVVTVTFNNPVNSFNIAKLTEQIRLDSITATVVETLSGYTITPQSSNTAHGTAALDGKYITATPTTGYEVAGYEIVSGTATVTRNGNVFTVEATSDVTIKINFAARTQYNVTFKEMGTTTSTQTAYNGDSITLPTIASGDYTVVGWVAAEIDGETTTRPTVYNAGSDYTVTGNTTFYALYSRTAAGGSGESNVFTEYTGTITEGDYLIVYSGKAMKATVSSNRFGYSEVTATSKSITSPDVSLIWTVTADGSYYTLYNESVGEYAAGNGTKNQGKLATSIDDFARWTVSGTTTYEFVNKGNTAKSVNANLRNNGTYGFACYSTSTGGALTLYKRTAAALTTYYFTGAAQTTYTVTANANNAEYGTVSVAGTTISATPNAGYIVSGYNITSGTATVTREGNTFFVTPSSNVTITINFEALPTYTVTFVENGEEVDSKSTYSGGFITLPNYSGELDEYTTFNGWAEAENETDATKIYAAKSNYAVTKNVTLYAQFTVTTPPVVEQADHYFVKVTEDQTDWSGIYLIVYEAGNKALNGGMTDDLDVANNNVDVQINSNKIAANSETMTSAFIIENTDEGYVIKSKSGFYIGQTSDANDLKCNKNIQYPNEISIDADGNAVVVSGGAYMRYNFASNQNRFRYFSSSTYTNQKPIALYKLDVAEISGAQVTVGSDLSVNYYVDGENFENIASGDLTMRFTLGEDAPVTVNGKLVGNQYVFTFTGLSPQRMGDNIKAELIYKGTVIGAKDEYSVKQNAINLLEKHADNESMVQFISDMLYYGAAAQKYSGYNKNNLVTDSVEGLVEASYNSVPNDAPVLENINSGTVKFKSATVWFDSVNCLIVKVNNPNNANVTVYIRNEDDSLTKLTYNESVGGYMTDAIKASEFGLAYNFELYENDTLVQKLQYSVNKYASSKQHSDNENMAQLAIALYSLGQSAEEYISSL